MTTERRRARQTQADHDLPADLAAGPLVALWAPDADGPRQARERAAALAWRAAGTTWSRANGLGWNGWLKLLSADVREADSARARLARLDD